MTVERRDFFSPGYAGEIPQKSDDLPGQEPSLESRSRLEKIKSKLKTWIAIGIITIGSGTIAERLYEKAVKVSPEQYIEYIEKSRVLPDAEKQNLSEKANYLRNEFSDHIFRLLKEGDLVASSTKEQPVKSPHVEGFEKIGLDNGQLQTLWQEGNYPKGTINGNVKDIKLKTVEQKITTAYHVDGATASADVYPFSGQVTFYAPKREIFSSEVKQLLSNGNYYRNPDGSIGVFPSDVKFHPRYGEALKPITLEVAKEYESQHDNTDTKGAQENLDWHFSHELGHLDDWANRKDLSAEERVIFLYDITQAFNRPGSFRDALGYVDQIKNPDKQKEKYFKVREWWGTLTEYYFTFPKDLFDQSEADYLLVEKWMKRADPSFDPIKAKEQRDSMIKSMSFKSK